MGYQDNVQQMCEDLGIENPIQEKAVRIAALSFKVNDSWQRIEGTDMNRAGRLYFQHRFADRLRFEGVHEHHWKDGILFLDAMDHFKDLWDDAEEKGRTLICALKQSSAVRIHWK